MEHFHLLRLQAVGHGSDDDFAGIGVLDPSGQPTKLLDMVKAADVARLDQASWETGREKMLTTCTQCHARDFARLQLQYGDDIKMPIT